LCEAGNRTEVIVIGINNRVCFQRVCELKTRVDERLADHYAVHIVIVKQFTDKALCPGIIT
jgi:hypothetical protein